MPSSCNVFVKALDGRTHTLDAKPEQTVGSLTRNLLEGQHLPQKCLAAVLLHQGRVLDPESTVDQAGIQNGTNLSSIYHPRLSTAPAGPSTLSMLNFTKRESMQQAATRIQSLVAGLASRTHTLIAVLQLKHTIDAFTSWQDCWESGLLLAAHNLFMYLIIAEYQELAADLASSIKKLLQLASSAENASLAYACLCVMQYHYDGLTLQGTCHTLSGLTDASLRLLITNLQLQAKESVTALLQQVKERVPIRVFSTAALAESALRYLCSYVKVHFKVAADHMYQLDSWQQDLLYINTDTLDLMQRLSPSMDLPACDLGKLCAAAGELLDAVTMRHECCSHSGEPETPKACGTEGSSPSSAGCQTEDLHLPAGLSWAKDEYEIMERSFSLYKAAGQVLDPANLERCSSGSKGSTCATSTSTTGTASTTVLAAVRQQLFNSMSALFQHPCFQAELCAADLHPGERLWDLIQESDLAVCLTPQVQERLLQHFFYEVDFCYEDDDDDAPVLCVNRDDLLGSSMAQLMEYGALDAAGLCIMFENEQAYGNGVLREWLTEVASQLFDPNNGLFRLCEGDPRALHPSPVGAQQDNHLDLVQFAGRIVGLAMRANVPLGIHLSTALYQLLQHPDSPRHLRLTDLEQLDTQLHTTCQNILKADSVKDMHLAYVVSHGHLGIVEERPLGEGGADKAVTDENRADYVQQLVQFYCTRGCSTLDHEEGPGCSFDVVQSFAHGIADVVGHAYDDEPGVAISEYLLPISAREFNKRLGGALRDVDVEEWRRHSDACGTAQGFEVSLEHFWAAVAGLGAEERRALLQFWTGMSHLPARGFKDLQQRLQVQPATTGRRIITAHTCFFQLLLPSADSREEMVQLVGMALANMHCFWNE